MGRKSIRIMNAERKLIEEMLMTPNSDQEIIKAIGISKTTFYRYKSRIYKEHAERFTSQRVENIGFYKEQLHTRLTKYLRILENKLASCNNDHDTAMLVEVTVGVAQSIFDLNLQGIQVLDSIRALDSKVRTLEIIPRNNSSSSTSNLNSITTVDDTSNNSTNNNET
jgi:ACT domain-containing protein